MTEVNEPLVVLTRRDSTSGWTLNLGPDGVVHLPEAELVVTHSDEAGLTIGTSSAEVKPATALELQSTESSGRAGPRTWRAELGEQTTWRNGRGTRCVVIAFRADDATQSKVLPDSILQLVARVRAADTPHAREILADALEEHGELAEAEYVRRELRLQAVTAADSPEFLKQLKEFRALSASVGTTFRYLVGRDVAGCTGLRWTFRCPRPWATLSATADERTRFCEVCRSPVVQTRTEAHARQLAAQGTCVAVAQRHDEKVGELAAPEWVGSVATPRPSPPAPHPTPAPAPSRQGLLARLVAALRRR